MILRTIHCERTGCSNKHMEMAENEGFSGWGHLVGLANEKRETVTLHICPECLLELVDWFKGGTVNGVD